MKTTSQNLLVDKYQLLSKASNGKFDASGKKELVSEKLEVTEQQFKDVVKGASKTGIIFVLSQVCELKEEVKSKTNKNK